MEDDEEFSYGGSEEKENPSSDEATFRDSEEVYSYSGYAEGSDAFTEPAEGQRPGSYGDFLIEEFSAETHVPRVAKITKLPENVVTCCFSAIYIIVGVLCVALTDYVTEYLPYIVGGMMAVIGVVRFIIALVRREYRQINTNRTASSLILSVLGAMIIVQELDVNNDSAIMLISVVWGVLGLLEGAHAFNHAFKRIANSERSIYYLIKGIVECAVAFMLLYQPTSHEMHNIHIKVFGINLIFDAITMIPPIKSFLSMK